jgi:hypothetical protein
MADTCTFEIHRQTEDVVYADANGNTIESPRGYWFRIVDGNGTVLANSDLRHARKASTLKVIREILDSLASVIGHRIVMFGGPAPRELAAFVVDRLVVDRTEDDA